MDPCISYSNFFKLIFQRSSCDRELCQGMSYFSQIPNWWFDRWLVEVGGFFFRIVACWWLVHIPKLPMSSVKSLS